MGAEGRLRAPSAWLLLLGLLCVAALQPAAAGRTLRQGPRPVRLGDAGAAAGAKLEQTTEHAGVRRKLQAETPDVLVVLKTGVFSDGCIARNGSGENTSIVVTTPCAVEDGAFAWLIRRGPGDDGRYIIMDPLRKSLCWTAEPPLPKTPTPRIHLAPCNGTDGQFFPLQELAAGWAPLRIQGKEFIGNVCMTATPNKTVASDACNMTNGDQLFLLRAAPMPKLADNETADPQAGSPPQQSDGSPSPSQADNGGPPAPWWERPGNAGTYPEGPNWPPFYPEGPAPPPGASQSTDPFAPFPETGDSSTPWWFPAPGSNDPIIGQPGPGVDPNTPWWQLPGAGNDPAFEEFVDPPRPVPPGADPNLYTPWWLAPQAPTDHAAGTPWWQTADPAPTTDPAPGTPWWQFADPAPTTGAAGTPWWQTADGQPTTDPATAGGGTAAP